MATSSSSSLYNAQQQQQLLDGETEPTKANLAASSRYSSGAIGPFFAVISVLVVLAVLSCFLGRICARGKALTVGDDPLEMIKGGWLRRKWRRFLVGDVEAGAKVADCGGKEGPKGSETPRA
ncbi:PREDICTED: uncharacterized protein LOC104812118 [Tarenaya hassleriana]|uniref:uncharacterized protein LOC104812118 n=1 Tax=Tarenaya hassleriana TaxID=28532 RepID=UPI00053C95E0|nr:PREDICTED: uncharacterized protein LOC104812118 [Tarenaya hassleriana]